MAVSVMFLLTSTYYISLSLSLSLSLSPYITLLTSVWGHWTEGCFCFPLYGNTTQKDVSADLIWEHWMEGSVCWPHMRTLSADLILKLFLLTSDENTKWKDVFAYLYHGYTELKDVSVYCCVRTLNGRMFLLPLCRNNVWKDVSVSLWPCAQKFT